MLSWSAPLPPTFRPHDRFLTPGDCLRLGHVYQAQGDGHWMCLSCSAIHTQVAELIPAPEPAPTPIHFARPTFTKVQTCLHEGVEPGTVTGIACPCPRHSPRSIA